MAAGRWFAFHQFAPATDRKMLPDLVSCAKPLGLGIPLGAVLLKEEVAASIARNEARHRRMIIGAETHDDVLDRGDTFSFKVAYRPT